MECKNHDFDAFMAKVGTSDYEKRGDPNIEELSGTINKIAGAVEDFRSNFEKKLDTLEVRIARPGALSTESIDERPEEQRFAITPDGLRLPLVTKTGRLTDYCERGSSDEFNMAAFVRGAVIGSQKAASGPALVDGFLSSQVIDMVRRKMVLINAGTLTTMIDGPTTFCRITGDPTVHQHTESSADISESDIYLTPVTANPKLLVATVPLTEELVQDSFNLDSVLQRSITAAFAQKLDALGLATILADANIPVSASGQDPADWVACLAAVGSALAADQSIPDAMICSAADFIARASQQASTSGSWLGKPPALSALRELPTTGVNAGTAIYGGFANAAIIAVRNVLRFEVSRWADSSKATHLLVAHMRADLVMMQPSGLFIQKATP